MKLIVKVLLFVIRLYKIFISPWLPSACRHLPTCSEYAKEAIIRHGVILGIVAGAMRILRCAPWGTYGYDPVPAPFSLYEELKKLKKIIWN